MFESLSDRLSGVFDKLRGRCFTACAALPPSLTPEEGRRHLMVSPEAQRSREHAALSLLSREAGRRRGGAIFPPHFLPFEQAKRAAKPTEP